MTETRDFDAKVRNWDKSKKRQKTIIQITDKIKEKVNLIKEIKTRNQ